MHAQVMNSFTDQQTTTRSGSDDLPRYRYKNKDERDKNTGYLRTRKNRARNKAIDQMVANRREARDVSDLREEKMKIGRYKLRIFSWTETPSERELEERFGPPEIVEITQEEIEQINQEISTRARPFRFAFYQRSKPEYELLIFSRNEKETGCVVGFRGQTRDIVKAEEQPRANPA
jgi:hypothetical protein